MTIPQRLLGDATIRMLMLCAVLAASLAGPADAQSTGRITGAVTAAGTGLPLAGITLRLTNWGGIEVATGGTDAAGEFALTGLAAGSYYLQTENASGYVNKLYDDLTCAVPCVSPVGKPIVVAAGGTIAGINFALAPGGSIAGSVVDAATKAAITTGNVLVYDMWERNVASVSIVSGRYTATGLVPGTYFLRASGVTGYTGQVYKPRVCTPSCGRGITGVATGVGVAAGAATAGIDFLLAPVAATPVNGAIAGVVSTTFGLSRSGIFVKAYDPNGIETRSTNSDASGQYTLANLPAGSYFIAATFPGVAGELYDDLPCPSAGCPRTHGTAVVVTAGITTSGINFAIEQAGTLAGKVTDAVTHEGLAGVTIRVYDSQGREVSSGTTYAAPPDAKENYYVPSLSTGTYYARASNSLGYLGQVYANTPCPGPDCAVLTGTPIQVTNAASTPRIDFALIAGGRITGTVIDAGTSTPLDGVGVQAYDATGAFVSLATTDASGTYTLQGLHTGSYFLKTLSSSASPFVDELFGGQSCPWGACEVKAGTPVAVTVQSTVSGIGFSLGRGGSIRGTIVDSARAAISGITVMAFNQAGTLLTRTVTDSAGFYAIDRLDTATYYLRTGTSNPVFTSITVGSQYLHEAYDDKPCAPGCDVLAGTGVSVTRESTTNDINFELAQGGAISGSIADAATNGVVNNFAFIGVYDSAGHLVQEKLVSNTRYAMDGLPAGTYFVRARVAGYLDQLYGGATCSAEPCNVTAGTPVVVTLGALATGVNFRLARGGSISGALTDALTGAPIESAHVVAHDASGQQVGSGTSLSNGQFTIVTANSAGMSSGTYFVRTASAGHLNQLYHAKPCGAGCVPAVTSGTAIVVSAGADTAGIDFTLVRRTVSASPSTLHFGAVKPAGTAMLTAVTAPQDIAVDFTSDAGPWTATVNRSWVQLTGGSGIGPGQFSAAIVNPGDVIGARTLLTATIMLTPSTGDLPAITIPVTLNVQPSAATVAPFGAFDTPATGAIVAGSIAVTGWALDDIGVERVELWRDLVSGETTQPYTGPGPGTGKVFIANAFFINGARPDVAALYAQYPQANRAGWGYLLLTQGLWNQGNGPSTLYAFAFDHDNRSAVLGSKVINVNNAAAVKPFGAIDTPGYGATVSGNVWNFGWALTPRATPTCTIPVTGVRVSIDSGPLQPVTYGDARADIAARFPSFSNGSGAGGSYYIDTTALGNGAHQIGWYVVDDCNRAEGIGSRFFSVLNSGSDLPLPSRPTTTAADAVREVVTVPVIVRRDLEAVPVEATVDGDHVVTLRQGERIEVELPATGGAPYIGYQIVNGTRRALPAGSSLDAASGVFYWQPAAGFLGTFDLEFVAATGGVVRVQVTVAAP